MRQTRQNSIQSFAFVISICIAVCLVWRFTSNSRGPRIASGQPGIELENRINPNTASLESLVRLPGLGISRAGAIIAYREDINGKNGSNPVFHDLQDLKEVKGIGPETVKNASEWLKFE